MTRAPVAALMLLAATWPVAPASGAHARAEWDFVVRLDGERIGAHRFSLSGDPSREATIASDALFEVRVLGFTAYRYVHRARERWAGSCLAEVDAFTDDDGRVTRVRKERPASIDGCLMSFAYWNPALRSQRRLLDPGTGRVVDVQVAPLPPQTIADGAGAVRAQGWRITGLPNAIDVWWSGGRWIGLDTVVGGRQLTYRLQ